MSGKGKSGGKGGAVTAPTAPLVTGQVVIAAGVPGWEAATVHIYLEDISYADERAKVVAKVELRGVRHNPAGETAIPFALHAPPDAPRIERRADYSVRVWVDHDGDGRKGPGDLYSDQTYPVLTQGFGTAVTVRLGTHAADKRR